MLEKPENPYVNELGDGVVELTDQGREFIAPLVTNVDDDIFAFTPAADRHMVSTAFMRYSRSKNGARELIAKEFSGGEDKDLDVAFRVSQEFGDDSVQQLFSVDLAIEGLSQLATKQVEWHRPGIAYLEKSTRYVPYTEKDGEGKYKYVRPSSLSGEELAIYETVTDHIFDVYCETVDLLTDYARSVTEVPANQRDGAWRAATRAKALDTARVLLPASTKTNVGIHASAQAMNNMILRLQASDIPEAVEIGQKALEEARKLSPVFFERTAWPHRGGRQIEYQQAIRENIQALAEKYLPPKEAELQEGQVVELRRYSPEEETELIAYMLFDEATAGYSLEAIKDQLSNLNFDERLELMAAYMGRPTNRRHKPGRALEQANYTWEFVSDFGAFRDLQRHRIVDDLRWQRLSTEHGFDIPELAVEAGLEGLYRDCIESSERLYEYLDQRHKPVEAQYAVLLGHKLRWTMKTNARSNKHIFELRSTPAGHPSYRRTVQTMHQEVARVHPLIAELSMPFMNQDEDAELGRLDQERAMESKRRLHRG